MSTATPNIITPERFGAEILRQARIFCNLVETRSNADWDNPATPTHERELVEVMRRAMGLFGWVPGQAYCIAWAGGMVLLAAESLGLRHRVGAKLQAVITPGVMETHKRASKLQLLADEYPQPGAIWLAQWGQTWKGHAGIVEQYLNTMTDMRTIEANTSAEAGTGARQREGEGIFTKLRNKVFTGSLITRGFINPSAWLA